MKEEGPFRYRIHFAKTSPMRYTSHLDTLRAWERTLRRAKMPLALTQGFNPRPRIHLSPALPLGFTSECELLDIWITEELAIGTVIEELQSVLPPGLEIHAVHQIQDNAPKLHEEIIAAEYHVYLEPCPPLDQILPQIDRLLCDPEIIRVRRGRKYNLRPLIQALEVHHSENKVCLRMCLATEAGATGRPEEVLDALQLDPMSASIHRKRFVFVDKA